MDRLKPSIRPRAPRIGFQRWDKLLFLHWELPPDALRPLVHPRLELDTFEGRAAFGSWIYRVTTNAALNKRRGKRREVETSLDEHLPRYEADGRRAGDRSFLLADWSQHPDAELLSGEARRTLERALDAMPETYRAVLVLRDVEKLGNEEVAAMLGESVASVKSRLHRARMALREQLTQSLARH